MATKKKSVKKRATKKKPASKRYGGTAQAQTLKLAGGSPIIIDGGSCIVSFAHGEFNQSGNSHKHKSTTIGIRDVRVTGAVNDSIAINGQQVRITIRLQ
ncbi:MAG: hypothetical protein AABM67_00130 [Acidobacteriota bacterium]